MQRYKLGLILMLLAACGDSRDAILQRSGYVACYRLGGIVTDQNYPRDPCCELKPGTCSPLDAMVEIVRFLDATTKLERGNE